MSLEPNHRIPVTTVEDLNSLDGKEVVEGYLDAFDGWPCGENRSRAYWHGWRNGRLDAGLAEKDSAQAELAFNSAHQRWRQSLN